YNNGGYVVLALLAERAAGASFYDLVHGRVCQPAGLTSTAFLRSDALPPRAAIGYLDDEGLRTNVFHLPVRGSGDGGLYTCVSDVSLLWSALLDGRVLRPDLVERMVEPGRGPEDGALDHGLGMWLHRDAPVLEMHGYDAGVSFRSLHHRGTSTTCTVIANTGGGTWVVHELMDELVRG
ncbi:MAG TPA: serine hydrolase, partial [Candidatus Nanopelagicales bacterium]|nr:serine hydrolase [Candidatus Nanopelagicales bacterium]